MGGSGEHMVILSLEQIQENASLCPQPDAFLGAHPGVSQCSPELLSLLLCSEDSYTLYNQNHCGISKGHEIGLKSIINEKYSSKYFEVKSLILSNIKNCGRKHLLSFKILSFTLEDEKSVLKNHFVLSIPSRGFWLLTFGSKVESY